MSKKLLNNLFLLKNMRPKSGSKYRADADVIVSMYEHGEIKNVKTAFNLISKLASNSPIFEFLRGVNAAVTKSLTAPSD